jgi:hypothetical protein
MKLKELRGNTKMAELLIGEVNRLTPQVAKAADNVGCEPPQPFVPAR